MAQRKPVLRAEVWTGYSCDPAAVRVGILPLADLVALKASETFEGAAAVERLTAEVSLGAYYLSSIVERRILRVVYGTGVRPATIDGGSSGVSYGPLAVVAVDTFAAASDRDLSAHVPSGPLASGWAAWEYTGTAGRYRDEDQGAGYRLYPNGSTNVVARTDVAFAHEKIRVWHDVYRYGVDYTGAYFGMCFYVPSTSLGSWANDGYLRILLERTSSSDVGVKIQHVDDGGAVTDLATTGGSPVAFPIEAGLRWLVDIEGDAITISTGVYHTGASETVVLTGTVPAGLISDTSRRRLGVISNLAPGYGFMSDEVQIAVAPLIGGEDLPDIVGPFLASYDEYRIGRIRRRGPVEGTLVLECHGYLLDLAELNAVTVERVGGVVSYTPTALADSVENHVTNAVLPLIPTFWEFELADGPISSIIPSLSGTALAILLEIVARATEADNIGWELWAEQNEDISLRIRIGIKGSDATTAHVALGRELLELELTSDAYQSVTRKYTKCSDGRGIGDARFKVTAVVASTSITVADINGSMVPIGLADGQFATGFEWIDKTGTAHTITGYDLATNTLSMADTTDIDVDGWGQLRLTGGDELAELEHPTALASYGIRIRETTIAELVGRTNFASDGNFENGGVNWTSSGTLDTTPGNWLTGGQSVHLDGSDFVGRVFDSPTGDPESPGIYAAAGDVVTYQVFLRVNAWGSSACKIAFYNPVTLANEFILLNGTDATVNELGIWYTVTRRYRIVTGGQQTLTPQVLCAGGGDIHVDAFNLVLGDVDPPSRYIRNSEAATAHLRTVLELQRDGNPPKYYGVQLSDLYRADSSRFPRAALVHGGDLAFAELADLGAEDTARIVGLETNLIGEETDGGVTLARRLPLFSRS